MKNINKIYSGVALVAIMSFAAIGCKKEVIVDDSAKYQPELLINDADNQYINVDIIEGDENTEFSSENEGLPEVYLLEEIDLDNAGFKRGIEKHFISCLKKLHLSDTQVIHIRRIFNAFEHCKEIHIKGHHEDYAKLRLHTESLRKDYISQLKDHKITRSEFETKMKELKENFIKSFRHIKENYAKSLKACYEKFIHSLKNELTHDQWKALVDCQR